jgi:hypothetical protein
MKKAVPYFVDPQIENPWFGGGGDMRKLVYGLVSAEFIVHQRD